MRKEIVLLLQSACVCGARRLFPVSNHASAFQVIGAAAPYAKVLRGASPDSEDLEAISEAFDSGVGYWDPLGLVSVDFWDHGSDATVGFSHHDFAGSSQIEAFRSSARRSGIWRRRSTSIKMMLEGASPEMIDGAASDFPLLPSTLQLASMAASAPVEPASPAGAALGLAVGGLLGLLGGGGSILALPIFIGAFAEPTQSAIAESLVVVSVGAGVGLLARLQAAAGVNIDVAAPFAAIAVAASITTAKIAGSVPEQLRLGLFFCFALASSVSMWQSSLPSQSGRPAVRGAEVPAPQFSTDLALRAIGVGSLTSLIGAGGGFVIVPALTLSGVPVKEAVGSALLVICLNSAAGFASFCASGDVQVNWDVVAPFAASVAAGALTGSSLADKVDAIVIKRLFSSTVLLLCAQLLATKLPSILAR